MPKNLPDHCFKVVDSSDFRNFQWQEICGIIGQYIVLAVVGQGLVGDCESIRLLLQVFRIGVDTRRSCGLFIGLLPL